MNILEQIRPAVQNTVEEKPPLLPLLTVEWKNYPIKINLYLQNNKFTIAARNRKGEIVTCSCDAKQVLLDPKNAIKGGNYGIYSFYIIDDTAAIFMFGKQIAVTGKIPENFVPEACNIDKCRPGHPDDFTSIIFA